MKIITNNMLRQTNKTNKKIILIIQNNMISMLNLKLIKNNYHLMKLSNYNNKMINYLFKKKKEYKIIFKI